MPRRIVYRYHAHENQRKIHEDKHRFRVVVCGRRFGKTTLAVNELIANAILSPGSINWYVAPTYRQAKQIAWHLLQDYLPKELIKRKHETELVIDLDQRLLTGDPAGPVSKIELKGADNPNTLRGVRIDMLVMDEVAFMRDFDKIWNNILRQPLMDSRGRAIFISTPSGFNHFHVLAKKGDHKGEIEGEPLEPVEVDKEYCTFRFTSYDNPHISPEEIDSLREEIPEEAFDQEILARFTTFVGRVYKDFDRRYHVIEPFEIPPTWDIYRGLDIGHNNPTACLFIAVDNDDNWYIFDEHYESRKTIEYHAGRINAKSTNLRVIATYIDPSASQWVDELARYGVYVTPANKEVRSSTQSWVRAGIAKIQEKLRRRPGRKVEWRTEPEGGEPGLFVFKTCRNTIREFETYRWKKRPPQSASLNEPEEPEKSNDHAMDALRYFAVSYAGRLNTFRYVPSEIEKKDWTLR